MIAYSRKNLVKVKMLKLKANKKILKLLEIARLDRILLGNHHLKIYLMVHNGVDTAKSLQVSTLITAVTVKSASKIMIITVFSSVSVSAEAISTAFGALLAW